MRKSFLTTLLCAAVAVAQVPTHKILLNRF